MQPTSVPVRMTTMFTNLTAVAVATAALSLTIAGPASAELYGVDDPRDTSHGSDVISLSVRNGAEEVDVTTYHEDLRRDPATGSSGTVYLDTDRADRGPEYVFVGGFYEGTDYVLRATEGFGPGKWGDPVEQGDYIMRVDYRKDRVHVRMSRAALGDPGAVRVAVRVTGTRRDGSSHGLVDWVGAPRAFTPWVARG